MKIKTVKIVIIALSLSVIFSCREVTRSSSMALDNANSVIDSGSGNLWGSAETPEERRRREASNEKRY